MTSEDPGNQAPESNDEQMTAEEYRQVAKVLAREERWEDLAALFIERAETAGSASNRARHLVHAAQVFEKNLGDADRAYITLLAAFQDDPANEDAVAELTRVATSLDRFPELLEECMAVAAQLAPPEKQAAMYVAISAWFRDKAGDASSSGGRSDPFRGIAWAGRDPQGAWRFFARGRVPCRRLGGHPRRRAENWIRTGRGRSLPEAAQRS
jgi:hypothetical protein